MAPLEHSSGLRSSSLSHIGAADGYGLDFQARPRTGSSSGSRTASASSILGVSGASALGASTRAGSSRGSSSHADIFAVTDPRLPGPSDQESRPQSSGSVSASAQRELEEDFLAMN